MSPFLTGIFFATAIAAIIAGSWSFVPMAALAIAYAWCWAVESGVREAEQRELHQFRAKEKAARAAVEKARFEDG